MYKNLDVIQKILIKYVSALVMLFSAVSLFFGHFDWAISSVMGSLFSFMIFNQLLQSQSKILKHRDKTKFFIPYLIRLSIIAFVLVVARFLQGSINFVVVIIFLFSFHFLYIIFELKKNYKHYKRRKKQWTN